MPSVSADLEMTEAPGADPPVPQISDLGTRSAPRRLAEPIPRLGSPFTEISTRPFNTFPRVNYVPTAANPRPFQQRLLELAAEHAAATRHQSR
ncbi:hypothetical protein Tdes44962_MAKER09539 [Teratosphaeria destructans]|uniref:Uncharacterized protein n=1 Tax=Teratosphaeria destructans TaxID=418781 RepID=A0A9W7SSU8_9PEZI|nr:hypothetical protein Tdes44962_MAKER09539 [Teratosphaeria destructans]